MSGKTGKKIAHKLGRPLREFEKTTIDGVEYEALRIPEDISDCTNICPLKSHLDCIELNDKNGCDKIFGENQYPKPTNTK